MTDAFVLRPPSFVLRPLSSVIIPTALRVLAASPHLTIESSSQARASEEIKRARKMPWTSRAPWPAPLR